MVKGKRYRVMFDHKPTNREAEEALREKIVKAGDRPNGKLTFKEAATSYVEMKRNVLSPSTIRGYNGYIKNFPKWFLDCKIDDITQVELNKFVNEITPKHSPKTVRNAHGLVSAILGTFRPKLSINTTLPQKLKIEPYTPTDEDVRRILEELRESMFYVPIVLACFGLRRGEICALEPADVEGNIVHVTKALAIDENNNRIIKSTKTTESTRDVPITTEIANIIKTQGYVYNGAPNSIVVKLEATEKKLGIPKFSLHKLRHYFATKMLTITDDKTVQKMGGWKTDIVMKQIYAHSMKDAEEKAKKAAIDVMSESIF
jgi:integrase